MSSGIMTRLALLLTTYSCLIRRFPLPDSRIVGLVSPDFWVCRQPSTRTSKVPPAALLV